MSKKQTANNAVDILLNKRKGFVNLTPPEKNNLAIVLMKKNMVIYGKAYDIVRCNKKINFSNQKEIEENLDSIIIYEIKSTNQKKYGIGFFQILF